MYASKQEHGWDGFNIFINLKLLHTKEKIIKIQIAMLQNDFQINAYLLVHQSLKMFHVRSPIFHDNNVNVVRTNDVIFSRIILHKINVNKRKDAKLQRKI